MRGSSSGGARSQDGCTPNVVAGLLVPDPRLWPPAARERFNQMRGDCGALDISIFVWGRGAAIYCQDAITALGIFEIDPSEWKTDGGFPVFLFSVEKLAEYGQRLAACGYVVRIL